MGVKTSSLIVIDKDEPALRERLIARNDVRWNNARNTVVHGFVFIKYDPRVKWPRCPLFFDRTNTFSGVNRWFSHDATVKLHAAPKLARRKWLRTGGAVFTRFLVQRTYCSSWNSGAAWSGEMYFSKKLWNERISPGTIYFAMAFDSEFRSKNVLYR